MQEFQPCQCLLHDVPNEFRLIQLIWIGHEYFPKRKYLPILLLCQQSFHQLDKVFQISFTFFNCQTYEVLVFFLIVVCNQVRVQVNLLEKLNFIGCNMIMLCKHPFYSNSPPIQSSFVYNSPSTPQAKYLRFFVNNFPLYLLFYLFFHQILFLTGWFFLFLRLLLSQLFIFFLKHVFVDQVLYQNDYRNNSQQLNSIRFGLL
ncbi:hypothetical protein FGO68_gene10977 [Halteria grandinella]|uniref:Uncharacterized protein n=1 Tax=Halteria grandinella TaxID=5974 RepID=A0A8J8N9T9_HALGN|nr:hypothetical protein FGO68_gene10977 [Halteria grandinella]